MSRTKRYVPHWARGPKPYELAWRGLGGTDPLTGEDPRNRWERGYDKHKATSGVCLMQASKHCNYREEVTGPMRKWYKRSYAKAIRREGKQQINRETDYELLERTERKCIGAGT